MWKSLNRNPEPGTYFMTMRASMSVSRMPGAATRNRTRLPSRTPAGTRRLTARRPGRSPMPAHSAHQSLIRPGRALPRRSAAPARRAGRSPPERLARRDDDVGPGLEAGRPAEERLAHAVEDREHRRKVHVDFVGQAVRDIDGQLVARNVRVIAARELAVRPLDLVRARVPRDAEDVVVVAHSLKARYHARQWLT